MHRYLLPFKKNHQTAFHQPAMKRCRVSSHCKNEEPGFISVWNDLDVEEGKVREEFRQGVNVGVSVLRRRRRALTTPPQPLSLPQNPKTTPTLRWAPARLALTALHHGKGQHSLMVLKETLLTAMLFWHMLYGQLSPAAIMVIIQRWPRTALVGQLSLNRLLFFLFWAGAEVWRTGLFFPFQPFCVVL